MTNPPPLPVDVPGVLRLNDEAYYVHNDDEVRAVLTAAGGWYARTAKDYVNFNPAPGPHLLVLHDLTIRIWTLEEYQAHIDTGFDRLMKLKSDMMKNAALIKVDIAHQVPLRD